MFFDPQCKPVDARAQALLDAAALIEQRGWCQGWAERDGAVCVMRAMLLVAPTNAIYGEAIQSLEKVLGTRYPHLWNDVPGRTKAEVVAMLRKAGLG